MSDLIPVGYVLCTEQDKKGIDRNNIPRDWVWYTENGWKKTLGKSASLDIKYCKPAIPPEGYELCTEEDKKAVGHLNVPKNWLWMYTDGEWRPLSDCRAKETFAILTYCKPKKKEPLRVVDKRGNEIEVDMLCTIEGIPDKAYRVVKVTDTPTPNILGHFVSVIDGWGFHNFSVESYKLTVVPQEPLPQISSDLYTAEHPITPKLRELKVSVDHIANIVSVSVGGQTLRLTKTEAMELGKVLNPEQTKSVEVFPNIGIPEKVREYKYTVLKVLKDMLDEYPEENQHMEYSGVCKFLSERLPSECPKEAIGQWVQNYCFFLNPERSFIDKLYVMTPKRREFIHNLIRALG